MEEQTRQREEEREIGKQLRAGERWLRGEKLGEAASCISTYSKHMENRAGQTAMLHQGPLEREMAPLNNGLSGLCMTTSGRGGGGKD